MFHVLFYRSNIGCPLDLYYNMRMYLLQSIISLFLLCSFFLPTLRLDTVMGTDTSIDFKDFLDVSTQRPDTNKLSLHDVLEVKFGL